MKSIIQDFSKEPTVRVLLELTPQINEQLKELEKRTSASSLTEVFQKALALYDMLTDHVQKGGDLIFRDHDGTEHRIGRIDHKTIADSLRKAADGFSSSDNVILNAVADVIETGQEDSLAERIAESVFDALKSHNLRNNDE